MTQANSSSRDDKKRGRHKKRVSKETLTWEENHLIPPKPSWMPEATYTKLAKMRHNL